MYPWPDARQRNPQGEEHSQAKVTEAQIREVFAAIISGEITTAKQVQEFLGLTKGPTFALLGNRNWTHLPRPPELQAAIDKMIRKPLTKEQSEEVVRRLIAKEPREDIVRDFNLTPSKLQWYFTKANKAQGINGRSTQKA
jgi:hypothetical protein